MPRRKAHELVRRGSRLLPIHVDIAGPARWLMLRAYDPVFGRDRSVPSAIDIGGHPLLLDLQHDNERLLSYCWWNVVRHFRASPLGRFIRARARRPGAVFVDVGANLGLYALLAKETHDAAWVVECEPRHVAFLERNRRHFDRVFPIAASDRDGVAEFFVAPSGNAGASSLVGAGTTYSGAVSVPTQRLDALLPGQLAPGQDVALIKVDVEGAEESVVAGLAGLFQAPSRPALWCEVRGPKSGRARNTQAPVCALMAAHGYAAFRSDGVRHTPFSPASGADVPRVFDLLFLPR